MRIVVYSTHSYDKESLSKYNTEGLFAHELVFLDAKLSVATALLAIGATAVCIFVNDNCDAQVIRALAQVGVKVILLRCAGFNNVDLEAAQANGMTVMRVPAYSPNAVAEHAVAMLLCLNRHLHRAYSRVRDGNFSLDGLLGFDVATKTVGVIGTGKIGFLFAKIMKQGFGARVIAYDVFQSDQVKAIGIPYVSLDQLYAEADIISLHVPLLPSTKGMINAESIKKMKPGVMLINTSRGPLVDTRAVIHGLKTAKFSAVGLDVYEEEGDIFFEDHSGRIMTDDALARLLTFPNVLVTGHQAFFTATALEQIAKITLQNASDCQIGKPRPGFQVKPPSSTPPPAAASPPKAKL